MSTEQQLREAVLATPDDHAPRLAYAAWLLEKADPRGDLITLQCNAVDGDDDRELRLRALWQAHGARWMTEDVGFAPSDLGPKRNAVYRDGFLHTIELSLEELLERADQLAAQPIHTLRVTGLDSRLEALARCRLLETVRCLDLGHGLERLGNGVLAQFLAAPGLRRVESLVFSPHEEVDAIWGALERFPRLAELQALRTASIVIQPERARWLGQSLPALESLSCDTGFTADSLLVLAENATFRLKKLALMDRDGRHGRSAYLGDETIARFVETPMLRDLTSLSLFGCHLGERTAETLPKLPCAHTLESLDVGSQVHPAATLGLAHCELPALTWLSIRHNELRDSHLEILRRFPKLETLRVEKNGITSAGAKLILAQLPKLRELYLDDTSIADAGALAIAWSEGARSLRKLSLSHVGLGKDAIEGIVESGNLNELRTLDVSENQISRPGIRSLADGPFDRMAYLSVSGAMRGDTAPLFEDAWLPYHDSFEPKDTYERRLDPAGHAVERKPSKKKPVVKAEEPTDARELDPSETFAVGEHVRHAEHGVGVVMKVHALYLEAKYRRVGLVRSPRVPPGAIPFDTKRRFETGESILHPTFGAGLIVNASSDRVEVEFGLVGSKTLVHNRA
jgi:uncharacterized protein (TIGR02996 family)